MYSIIIPAYNEEMRIKGVVLKYAQEFPGDEIVVVCDGTDRSEEILRSLFGHYPNVRLFSFVKRLGKGGAILQGFRFAKGNRFGFVDADDSIDAACLKDMFRRLDGFDAVIASRRHKNSTILVHQPWKRRLASICFNYLVRLLFGLPFKDTQCGAKVFRKAAITDVLDDLQTTGFETDVEILWRLKEKGYKIMEYPITWRHSQGSKFSLFQSPGMLISLLKVRFK